MEQFDLYIHGVPVGHEICGCDADLDYIKGFYNHDAKVEVSSLLQIDVVNGKSFYTYLRKKNIRNAEGRPGSYFGLTVSFAGRYCTSVQMLYAVLDAIYRQVCVNCLIKSEAGGDRFLVKEISACSYKNHSVIDFIKAAFNDQIENLHFEKLNGFSSSNAEATFSLKEVDSPLFFETMQQRRILVSPEYGTASVAYNNLLKELEPMKKESAQLKTANAQLTESKENLSKEVARLERETAESNTSAGKKYKKQLDALQAQLEKCKQEKDELDAKIKEATSAVDLMDEPVLKLTRLLASRFQEKNDKVGKRPSEVHSANRTEHKEATWIPMGSIILLLVVAIMCGYCCYAVSQLSGSVTDAHDVTDSISVTTEPEDSTTSNKIEEEPIPQDYNYNDFYRIDITPAPTGTGDIKLVAINTEYTLTIIKKGSAPDKAPSLPHNATWQGNGIRITSSKFTVSATSGENVQVFYTVNNKKIVTRTLRVQ